MVGDGGGGAAGRWLAAAAAAVAAGWPLVFSNPELVPGASPSPVPDASPSPVQVADESSDDDRLPFVDTLGDTLSGTPVAVPTTVPAGTHDGHAVVGHTPAPSSKGGGKSSR